MLAEIVCSAKTGVVSYADAQEEVTENNPERSATNKTHADVSLEIFPLFPKKTLTLTSAFHFC